MKKRTKRTQKARSAEAGKEFAHIARLALLRAASTATPQYMEQQNGRGLIALPHDCIVISYDLWDAGIRAGIQLPADGTLIKRAALARMVGE